MSADDREGIVRIRDAAIELFGEKGVAGTSLKSIAARAEVSQGLVIHHFGSKAGLHRACDEHVARLIRNNKETVLAGGPQMNPLAALQMMQESRPLLRYLVRTLSEGGEQVGRLVDDMVADAEVYMAASEQAGLLKPSSVPRERAVVLVLWSLGALVLHEQLHRLLGVDFLAPGTDPEDLAPYFRPVMELYTQGLITEGAYSEMAGLFEPPTDTTATDGTSAAADHQETS
ncbi:TetR family transcriptional regulator [Janibacter cremeus]|uniref:TetR/AcrR family transcriptional regulator n=1 Tax=Janibacter cremeus TaxID=1285192 RepID=UPI0023F95A53|nr:TetR family transcriptional regulator [Janibacter cremeus]WEV77062.1 TetR family transcriptional regulator [Janibacter cremeus]